MSDYLSEADQLAAIFRSKHQDSQGSPYSTEVLPTDPLLVQHIKRTFEDFADRLWGGGQGREARLIRECVPFIKTSTGQIKVANPNARLFQQQIEKFDPDHPGLTPQDYQNYRKALANAYALYQKPGGASTADIILEIVQECRTFDNRIHQIGHDFHQNITTLINAITGYVNDDGDFVRGIHSAHPDDVWTEQNLQARLEETNDPYGQTIAELRRPRFFSRLIGSFADLLPNSFLGLNMRPMKDNIKKFSQIINEFEKDPSIDTIKTRIFKVNHLKIKMMHENALTAAFNSMVQMRQKQAKTPEDPVHNLVKSYEGIIQTDQEMRDVLIRNFGRNVYELLNGRSDPYSEPFVGLKGRGKADDVKNNLAILAQILSTTQSEKTKRNYLNLSLGNFGAESLTAYFRGFIIEYARGELITTGQRSDFDTISREGIESPNISEENRIFFKHIFRDYINIKRHEAFDSFVSGIQDSSGYLGSPYDPRFLIRHWHEPGFGQTYAAVIDRKMALLGGGRNTEMLELFEIKNTLSDQFCDPVKSVIGVYYHLGTIVHFLMFKNNPLCVSGKNLELALEIYLRKAPDPLNILALKVLSDTTETSERLEIPFGDNMGSIVFDNIIRKPLDKFNTAILLHSGSYHDTNPVNFKTPETAALALDNACMNHILRGLYEMRGVFNNFDGAPHINKKAQIQDWANKASDVLTAIVMLAPDMARCRYGVSKNLRIKSMDLFRKINPDKEMYYREWVKIVSDQIFEVFDELRERYRSYLPTYQGPAIGHGSFNFLTDPSWDIAGGAQLVAPMAYGRYDKNGNVVFNSLLEGYVYDSGGTLSDPEIPSGTFVERNGKYVLTYVRWSAEKVAQIYEWEKAKRDYQIRLAQQRGDKMIPEPLKATDIMPMTTKHPQKDPGMIGIAYKDGKIARTQAARFGHGDRNNAVEPLAIHECEYILGFNYSPITRGSLSYNKELWDPLMMSNSDASFPTIAKTLDGNITYRAPIMTKFDKKTNTFVVEPYSAEVINGMTRAFNANLSNIHYEISEFERKQMVALGGSLQTLEMFVKKMQKMTDIVDNVFHQGQEPEKQKRSSLRATPAPASITVKTGLGQETILRRGLSYFSINMLRLFDTTLTARSIDQIVEHGIRSQRYLASSDHVISISKFFGSPERYGIYYVPPASNAVTINGVELHTQYKSVTNDNNPDQNWLQQMWNNQGGNQR